jgi:hypothetical protein
MQSKSAHAEAQRRRESKGFEFSAPLRLCVRFLLRFICVHLIHICGKNAFFPSSSALRNVFLSSIATVIGPTPPGTGVI